MVKSLHHMFQFFPGSLCSLDISICFIKSKLQDIISNYGKDVLLKFPQLYFYTSLQQDFLSNSSFYGLTNYRLNCANLWGPSDHSGKLKALTPPLLYKLGLITCNIIFNPYNWFFFAIAIGQFSSWTFFLCLSSFQSMP